MFYRIATALCCMIPLFCSAQSKVSFGRSDDGAASVTNEFTVERLTDHVYNTARSQHPDMVERDLLEFAYSAGRGTSQTIEAPTIYRNWPEINDYVNRIMQRVLPADYPGREVIKAYVIKDGSTNAFMTPSGQFFIHIGLLPDLTTEASLAGVIAHELAHYTRSHSLSRFVAEMTGEIRGTLFVDKRSVRNSFSVDNELDADATAREYMLAAGYDLQGLIDVFKVFKRNEDQVLLRFDDVWELKETTHPSNTRRIDAIKDYAEAQTDNKESYKVSEPLFLDFKEAARAETLKYLLSANRYNSTLESAFKFHLLDPNNPTYIYYAMEAIRRNCYLDVREWSKNFITSNYHEIVERRGDRSKIKIEGHFFEKFRPELLGMPEDSWDQVQAQFYWEGDAKFTTNEEAYAFFHQIGKLFEEPECTLSNALSLSFDEDKMRAELQAYLDYGDHVAHAEFARAMLEDGIYEALPDKKMTALRRFLVIAKQSGDNILLDASGADSPVRKVVADASAADTSRVYVDLSDPAAMSTEDALLFANLEEFSARKIFARGDKTEMYILNPDYWDLLKRYGVNEINFVNVYFQTKAEGKRTAEDYRKAIETPAIDYLNDTESKIQVLAVPISSVRIQKDETMKNRYFGGERRVSPKKDKQEQIIEYLSEDFTKVWEAEGR